MILADDLGWASVGWHRPKEVPRTEIHTPNMDKLVENGIELDRAYVMWFCAPSRSSLQSGRLPVHEHISALGIVSFKGDQGMGMPNNMTGMAEPLKAAGYATHFVGKWDVGFANPAQLPVRRGYDTSWG